MQAFCIVLILVTLRVQVRGNNAKFKAPPGMRGLARGKREVPGRTLRPLKAVSLKIYEIY